MADASLSQSIVVGAFTVAGAVATALVTIVRDVVQQRHEKQKRCADKFEELVATVYEFDHWVGHRKSQIVFDLDEDVTVSPFCKVQSITSVYFPQFLDLTYALDCVAKTLLTAMVDYRRTPAEKKAFDEAHQAYAEAREKLLSALQGYARAEVSTERRADYHAKWIADGLKELKERKSR
jgi:hypothetical protein